MEPEEKVDEILTPRRPRRLEATPRSSSFDSTDSVTARPVSHSPRRRLIGRGGGGAFAEKIGRATARVFSFRRPISEGAKTLYYASYEEEGISFWGNHLR